MYISFLISGVCKTVEEDGKSKLCRLPFIWQGREFPKCTWDSIDATRPWCSTKVYDNRTHVEGKFGFCVDECPADPKPHTSK